MQIVKDGQTTSGASEPTEEQLKEALRLVREDGQWGHVVMPTVEAWELVDVLQGAIADWRRPGALNDEGVQAWDTLRGYCQALDGLARIGRDDLIAASEAARDDLSASGEV